MIKISLIEKKINEKILEILKEKRNFMNAINVKSWKMVVYALKHLEKLHIIIIGGMTKKKKQ